MKKFLLFLISTAVSTSLISPNERNYCMQDGTGDFQICGHSDVITFVNGTVDDGHEIELNVENFSAIAPYAFRNVTTTWLTLYHPNSAHCTPKVINLAPESFDGLSVRALDLQCVKFAIKVNPFKNVQTITHLRLKTIEFTEISQDLFTDLPHLERLILFNVNITIVSPNIFSGINEKLQELWVFDEISVIESKSFERFYNLSTLELHGGQLADLQSDMFDGLNNLKVLALQNKITVLRNHTFSKLSRLQKLYLTDNKISQIESESFSGLNLVELYLDHNNLESLPVGVCHNLKMLRELNLEYNKLTTVPNNVFEGCVHLRLLRLRHNEIYHIDPKAFLGMHLHLLDLRYNNLTILENDTFIGLDVDGLLDLSFNNISKIETRAFTNLSTGQVKLCWPNITQVESDSWGWDHSSTGIFINDC